MAIPNITYWELRADGSDNNSGGYDPTSAYTEINLTAINATTASPTVSSSTYNFVSGDIGKWLYINSTGVWNPGWYLITSISGTSAVINASLGNFVHITNNTGPSAVVGCATTSSPTDGRWSIDYSQSSTAKASITNLVIDSVTNTIISSASYTFTKADVGNLIRITAGTNFTTGHYSIIGVNAGKATLDSAVGTVSSTGGTGYLGGGMLTFYNITGSNLFGHRFYVKNGTYSSNGSGASGSRFAFIGYNTLRGDNPQGNDRPLFRATANNITIINFSTAGISHDISGIRMDGSGFTGCTGFSENNSRNGVVMDCKVSNCATGFLAGNTVGTMNCEADTCTTGFSVSHPVYCVAKNCTYGFSRSYGGVISNCVTINCNYGFYIGNSTLNHCLAHNSSVNGVYNFTSGNGLFNCLITNSGGHGLADGGGIIRNCFGFGNTLGNSSWSTYGFTTLTVSPYVDATISDLRLNNTPGGGLLVKNNVYPKSFPGIPSLITYADASAAQSIDSVSYLNPEISILVRAGITSRTEFLYLNTTGMAFNSVGLSASYVRPGSARVGITLVTQTISGSWTSGGFVEVDSVTMPGLYRLDVPNAIFATGVNSAAIEIFNSNTNDRFVVTYHFTQEMQLDLAQPIPNSTNVGSIGEALNAMRAQGFGKWAFDGTNLSMYAADNVTILKTLTFNSVSNPTMRS